MATFYGGSKGVRQVGRRPQNETTAQQGRTDTVRTNARERATFRVVDIALSNGIFAVETAWTNGLFATGTKLDYLVKTNFNDETWMWSGCDTVAEGVTSSVHMVNLNNFATAIQGADNLTYRTLPASLFVRVVPRLPVSDMTDSDHDGLPDAYEFRNNTNPWVADYEQAALRVVVDNRASLQSIVDHCEPYAVLEVVPGTYSGPGWSNVILPAKPILITGRGGVPVFRTTGFASFLLPSNTTEETMIRNIYLDRFGRGLQVGFWCGGNLPWIDRSASATFDNVYVRFSNPRSSCYGWIFYGASTNRSVLSHCTVNASGASRVRGVYAINPPPLELDHDTFVNFPASSTNNTSAALLLETLCDVGETNGNPIAIESTVFDASFTNAEIIARLGPSNLAPITVQNSILPRAPAQDASIEASASLWITNAKLSAWGYPVPDSPADIAGAGALVVLDPTNPRDSDGDGLTDWQEAYQYGTSPIAWDSDGDEICDGDEIADRTDPNDVSNFAFNLTVCITNDTPNVPELRCSVFSAESTSIPIRTSSIPTNSICNINFDHLHVTSNSTPLVRIWYDANTNEICEANEWSKTLNYNLKPHYVSTSLQLSKFVDSGEGIPGYWWIANGVTNSSDQVAIADLDGDGLINLHEYWAGTHPQQKDGFNTLLSVLSRSIDSRISGTTQTNRVNLFSAVYTNTTLPSVSDNPSFWLSDVDLSCCSIWSINPPAITNDCKPSDYHVTLIGTQQVVYASHVNFAMPTNRIHIFRGRSGSLYQRRLIARKAIGYDISVGILDSGLPQEDFSPAQYLPTNFHQYVFNARFVPEFFLNEELKAYVMTFEGADFSSPGSKRYGRKIAIGNRVEFWKPGGVYSGSSSPQFFLLNSTPILIGTLWYQTAGNVSSAFALFFKEQIERSIHELEKNNNFSIQTIDLSNYEKLKGDVFR